MAMDFGGMRVPGGAGGIQAPGGGEGTGAVGGAAKIDDVSRFEDAMKGGQAEGAQALPENPAAAVQDAGKIQNSDSLGDRILKGFGSISDQIQAGRAQAVDTLGKTNVSQADLLRAQASMMESSTIISAVSKTASTITQGVKTLQQG